MDKQQIDKEYSELCAKIGDALYGIFVKIEQIKMLDKKAFELMNQTHQGELHEPSQKTSE